MNRKNSLTFTQSNSFTNTQTYTISNTNTNTHTNYPLIERRSCKGIAGASCHKRHDEILDFQVDCIQQMSPSTLPGRVKPAGVRPFLAWHSMRTARQLTVGLLREDDVKLVVYEKCGQMNDNIGKGECYAG